MNKYYLSLFGKALNSDLDRIHCYKLDSKYIHLAKIHKLNKSTINKAIHAYLNNGVIDASLCKKKRLTKKVKLSDCFINNIFYASIFFMRKYNF